MSQSGSERHRLRNAIVAAAFAAVIGVVAWTLIRGDHASPRAITARTTGATAIQEGLPDDRNRAVVVSKPAAPVKHATTAQALPPSNIPLAQTYAELKARADAGDAAAASRLFRDTYRCVLAREQILNMPAAVALLMEGDTSKLSAEQLGERERHLANMETHLADAHKKSKDCAGLDETQLLVTPTMLEAARLGDLAAGNCYVEGYLMSDPKLFDHPEWLPEFKSSALAIAQASVTKGDWGAVAQLQHAYARDGYAALLLGRILAPDPVQNYRYLKLRRLGANSENAPFYDRDLSFVARGLSADQVATGDAWAQDAYLSYFSAAPENTVGAYNSPACPDPGG